jgi:hypothetical protein
VLASIVYTKKGVAIKAPRMRFGGMSDAVQ